MKNNLSPKIFRAILTIAMLLPVTLFANTQEPRLLIQEMSGQFENEMIEHQSDIKKDLSIADELIHKHLVPNVNFLLMSRYVLGKNWKKADAAQQDEFVGLFKSLLIRFYSKAFVEYLKKHQIEKGMINILPYRAKSGSKYAKVKTEITVEPGAPKVQVKYTLFNSKTKGWKIYDISVEGISLVTSYRSSFKNIIAKEKINGLLNHLKKKLKQTALE
ncbi:MAG: ABC transporter substrate-binding protein [Pseudomonadota bacterium]